LPRRIITALDIEMVAGMGKTQFLVEESDVVTDIAREKADQLNIEIKKAGPEKEALRDSISEKHRSHLQDNKGEDSPHVKTDKSPDDLEKFKTELSQIKQDLQTLKSGSGESSLAEVVQRRTTTWRSPEAETQESGPVDLTIKNGNLVIPRLGIMQGDLEIYGSKIKAVTASGKARGDNIIDAAGLYVLPGIVDPHIHLGLFGELGDEIARESASALVGGVTTVGCFLNTDRSYFDYFPQFVELVEKNSYIDIYPHFVITKPEQVAEIPSYVEELKIKSFKIYMCGIPGIIPSMSDNQILDVFEKVQAYPDVTIAIHAENSHLVERATEKARNLVEEKNNLQSWEETRPSLVEEEAVKRAVLLAERYGVSIYLVHLSARESINVVRESRRRAPADYSLYAETTSPYLTNNSGSPLDARAKMMPPFRSREHTEALWAGLREGQIDTIGTDNVTITLAEKKIEDGMWGAMPGYPALATHLPSLLHEGVNGDRIDLVRLAEAASLRPAEIFGFYPPKGSLLPGSDADLAIVDLNKTVRVDPQKLLSRSDFSLFEGRKLRGWPVYTVKGGQLIMREGEISADAKRRGMVIRHR